jgi:hypothetical protein
MANLIWKLEAGLCAMIALVATAGVAQAEEVSFQQGKTNPLLGGAYTGTQDTFLNGQGPGQENSYGALAVAITGHDPNDASLRTALLRFDLTALQGQYTAINSATLTLFQRETSAQFTPFEVGAYEVSAANGDWVQGTTAAPASPGSPDWLHKSHDTAGWAGSPGMMTAGVDYVATPLDTTSWTSGGAGLDMQNTQYSFTLPAALIEQWIAGSNTGLMIQKTDLSTAGLAQYAAAEWIADPDGTAGPLVAADIRPLLTIDYTPIPEPSGLAALALTAAAALGRHRRRHR